MHRRDPLTADWFVERGVEASKTSNAAQKIEADLRHIAGDPHQFLRSRGDELTDEFVLHASARLTIVRVEAPPGAVYPPHDHRMVALIAMLVGEETNTYYRVTDGRLESVRTTRMPTGDTHRMGADVVHSIRNDGQRRSIGLHVYLGDLFATQRSVWDPITHERQTYTTTAYMNLAHRTATQRRDQNHKAGGESSR
jgi:predicted metal-dependent enzyme (double-stranded beta helix superfamily)